MNIVKETNSCFVRDNNNMFASNDPPKVLPSSTPHPLLQYIDANYKLRKQIATSHPEIESILLIQNDKLSELSIPMICPISEPNGRISERLACATGNSVSEPGPKSYDPETLFGDFFIFQAKPEEPNHFQSSPTVPGTFFSNKPKISKMYTLTKPIVLSRYPLTIPKAKGYNIIGGNIKSDDVQASLKGYHPSALAWLETFLDNDDCLFKEDLKTLKSLLPSFSVSTGLKRLSSRKFIGIDENQNSFDTSIRDKIFDEAMLIQVTDENKYFSENPDKVWTTVPAKTNKIQEKKDVNAMLFYLLFLGSSKMGSNNETRNCMKPPVLSKDIMDSYYLTQNEMVTFIRSTMNDFISTMAKKKNYLCDKIEFPYFNNTTLICLCQGNFHCNSLHEDDSLLDKKISALNFLPSPKEGRALKTYEEYMKESNRTFIQGRQTTVNDIQSLIANLVTVFYFLTDINSKDNIPDIIKILESMADMLNNTRFNLYIDYYQKTYPWIPHTILINIHEIVKSFVKIGNDVNLQRNVEYNEKVPAQTYQACWDIFYNLQRDINDTMGPVRFLKLFRIPPSSYYNYCEGKTKRPRDALDFKEKKITKRSHRKMDLAKKGWLVSSVGLDFAFPKLSRRIPCKFHALLGSECSNMNCKYLHCMFPHNFNLQDRTTIMKWVNSSLDVNFSDQVKKINL